MPPEETTTTRIFLKLDEISKDVSDTRMDVAVITNQLPHLATKDQVDLKIAEHAAIKPSIAPRGNGSSARKIAALITATTGLTSAIWLIVQFLVG